MDLKLKKAYDEIDGRGSKLIRITESIIKELNLVSSVEAV